MYNMYSSKGRVCVYECLYMYFHANEAEEDRWIDKVYMYIPIEKVIETYSICRSIRLCTYVNARVLD